MRAVNIRVEPMELKLVVVGAGGEGRQERSEHWGATSKYFFFRAVSHFSSHLFKKKSIFWVCGGEGAAAARARDITQKARKLL